ncbi:hypothetical protein LOC54_02670 [Acetobacter sp. AN02]|uniref:hypothetical protein n=1 Tax=Acetobacter sp. AN02 TaxID=2894186 RepID=UPI0024342ED5|nr:hypothetical protein [Acetobacter sp. AN02]MDG6094027.1 hypothetical protein [Acetobacter sp. AN02]
MSQSGQAPASNRISDLKVSGHLMTLDPGLFCVFHTPGAEPPNATGFPGVRIAPAPVGAGNVSVVTVDPSGWMGGGNNAALIRVEDIPGQVLVTIYQEAGSQHEAPKLQVIRLGDAGTPVPAQHQGPRAQAPAPQAISAAPRVQVSAGEMPEVAAHIQRSGDVAAVLGEWMGKQGSHAWIEGFGISPRSFPASDIEYQAVLGKGWLSPWSDGGSFCGSRGMALPILGLRVRLKGETAKTHSCTVEASFTDGSVSGPVDESMTAEAESLAPLEAFCVKITPRKAKTEEKAAKQPRTALVQPAVPARGRPSAAPVKKVTAVKAAPVSAGRGRPAGKKR